MTAPGVRPLTASDLPAMWSLLRRDPVRHCFVDSRVRIAGADPWRLGGELWGYFVDDVLESAVYLGANLIPVETTPAARAAFAARLRLMPRRCSSLVGPSEEILDLWRQLEPAWGTARDVRPRQPLLVMDGPSDIDADERVCVTVIEELDTLLPACVAMFTEEVGISPTANGAGSAYRARVAELVAGGRSLAWIDDGVVKFKAEIGIVTDDVSQVQGVYVDPAYRGRGLAAPAMAAVVRHCLDAFAPVVSLYVNDYNTAARKAYARVGFQEVGTFATVLC